MKIYSLSYKYNFFLFLCCSLVCLVTFLFFGCSPTSTDSKNKIYIQKQKKNDLSAKIPIFYSQNLCYGPSHPECNDVKQTKKEENAIKLSSQKEGYITAGCSSKLFNLKGGGNYKIKFKTTSVSTRNDPVTTVLTLHLLGNKLYEDYTHKKRYVQAPNSTASHELIFHAPHNINQAELYVLTKFFNEFSWEDFELELIPEGNFTYILNSFEKFTGYNDYNSSYQYVYWDKSQNGLLIKAPENILPPSITLNSKNWKIQKGKYSSEDLLDFNDTTIKINTSQKKEPIHLTLNKEILLQANTNYSFSFSYKCFNERPPLHILIESSQGEIIMNERLSCPFLKEEKSRLSRQGNGWIRRKITLPAYKRNNSNYTSFLKLRTDTSKEPFYLERFSLTSTSNFSASNENEEQAFIISSIYYVGECKDLSLHWKSQETSLTSLSFYVRTGTTPDYKKETWSEWKKIENGRSFPLLAVGFPLYVQWKCFFSSKDPHKSPVLHSVIISPQKIEQKTNELNLISIENGSVLASSKKYLSNTEKFKKENYGEKYKKLPGYQELKNLSSNITHAFDDSAQKENALIDFVIKNLNKGGHSSLEAPIRDYFIPFFYFDSLRKFGGGNCCHRAHILMNMCHMIDVPARMVGLYALNGRGHSVVEIWSDKYQKWYMVDPTYGGLFAYVGLPLSVFELRALSHTEAYNALEITSTENWFNPILPFQDAYAIPSQSNQAKLFDLCKDMFGYWYYDAEYEFMNDPHYQPIKFTKEEIDFPLNQIEMRLEYLSNSKIKIHLNNNGFKFKCYEVQKNKLAPRTFIGEQYIWKLKKGYNMIKFRCISETGKKGKFFTAIIYK